MSAKKADITSDKLADYLAWVILAILALLPFHAFFTTWLGANFGYLDLFRTWKELLTALLSAGAVVLLLRHKDLRKQFTNSFVAKLIIVYIGFTLLRALYGYVSGNVNLEATLYALLNDLRYFVFFVITWLVAKRSGLLLRYWQQAVVSPAVIVVVFGLLQQFVLDKNFLTHFGYGQATIPAYQAVDLKPEYARAQSTLRGPNPLGAYLSFIIVLLGGIWLKAKQQRVIYGLLIAMSFVLIFFTYSRSAWIGTVAGLTVLIILLINNQRVRKVMLLSIAVTLLITSMLVIALRNNNIVQNTFFHTDETSTSGDSSNQARASALIDNVRDAIKHPLGEGPGSAGPASFRNNAEPKIAENYYVQIAQELGWLGLVIYLLISITVAWELWLRKNDLLAAVLLASLVGITLINMVSHAWADDTLSLIWWGLAGIALSQPVILKANIHEKTKNTKKVAARA